MKAGEGPYIMATHAAPPQSSILPHVHVPPPAHTAYNIHVPIEIVCSSRSIMKMVINTYICVYLCLHVCVCPCSRCRLCCFCPYGGGGGGGWTAFSSISKFRTLQSAGRGYLNISLKCGSSFRLSPFCFSFFFFASPHNVTPSTIKCTFVCVCVCLWFIYVYFWGLATKCQAKKLRAQNFSFVVVLSTVGDLSNCFSFSRLETRFAFV